MTDSRGGYLKENMQAYHIKVVSTVDIGVVEVRFFLSLVLVMTILPLLFTILSMMMISYITVLEPLSRV